MKISVFGLGEAGALIGSDLAACSDITVHGYDPADVTTPAGIVRESDPQAAVAGADLVLALTAASDATEAMQQALSVIPKTAIYADFASASSELKQQLATHAQQASIAFCDVALMAIVPGNGIKAPCLLSGDGAQKFADLMQPLGMRATVVNEIAGEAAQRKLLRSVAMKGLAAVLIEAMEGASVAGCEEWLWKNLIDELTAADETFIRRLVNGTEVHALRRLHEMQASSAQLQSLGVDPIMTESTVKNLEKVLASGIPALPAGT